MFPEHLISGGGANVGKNKIAVEIGNISFKGLKYSLGVILDEVTYICFQFPGSYFDNLLKEFLKSLNKRELQEIANQFDNGLTVAFREAITSSIISEGLVDDILFKTEIRRRFKLSLKNINFLKTKPKSYFRKFMSYYLYPLNKRYLKQKRKIDKNYLRQVLKFMKKFDEVYRNIKNKVNKIIKQKKKLSAKQTVSLSKN